MIVKNANHAEIMSCRKIQEAEAVSSLAAWQSPLNAFLMCDPGTI